MRIDRNGESFRMVPIARDVKIQSAGADSDLVPVEPTRCPMFFNDAFPPPDASTTRSIGRFHETPESGLTFMSCESQTSILIGGMRDNRCRERLTEALERVTGVRHAEVSLYRGRAIVSHDARCTLSSLLRTIEEAGYTAKLNGKDHGG